ncbi:LysR family transcriptional regulator [Lachnospiraceae bacterium NSJ-143]|nr:LysR family transcriptional regulator [Lachnospiraceae bacterium NSJ-143]
MELKQLEFFVACVETGSFNKAAEKLYTSQPNVSKVIKSFEKELGKPLFKRNGRNTVVTDYGKSVYIYAQNIFKNINLISNQEDTKNKVFRLSTYQSHVLSRIVASLYNRHKNLKIDYFQGTIDEIINNVSHGISELGILYISKNQFGPFNNIILQKKLNFVEIDKRTICIMVGKNNPLYNQDMISSDKLSEITFIRGLNDFFSIEHHFEEINVGPYINQHMNSAIYTNSEYLNTYALLETDLATLGIDINPPDNMQKEAKILKIKGDDSKLMLGYIKKNNSILSDEAKEFLENFKMVLHSSGHNHDV